MFSAITCGPARFERMRVRLRRRRRVGHLLHVLDVAFQRADLVWNSRHVADVTAFESAATDGEGTRLSWLHWKNIPFALTRPC